MSSELHLSDSLFEFVLDRNPSSEVCHGLSGRVSFSIQNICWHKLHHSFTGERKKAGTTDKYRKKAEAGRGGVAGTIWSIAVNFNDGDSSG